MALTPAVLEMGTGIDLHGQNATEAARRAVWNAVHQSSLMFLGVFVYAVLRSIGKAPLIQKKDLKN